ncbi:MAG: type IV-A pilus assembly ATPase PilB [Deltaproteobacteria bacterium]|nr:type IV-A pilus assembly ATPase PilB [Deltaproteobacteria bacterium]
MLTDNLQEILINETSLTEEDFKQASADSRSSNISLMHAIEKLNKADGAKVLDIFSRYYHVTKVNLNEQDIDEEIVKLVPKNIAQQYRVIPIERVGNNLIVATGNPRNLEAMDTIRFKCGYLAKPILASETKITEALGKYYGKMDLPKFESKVPDSGFTRTTSTTSVRKIITGDGREDGPIIKLVNDILIKCLKSRASDIHFEAYEDHMRIRLRIDGALVEIARPPLTMKAPLISRIKIMAGLNIAESRLPQDGAINISIEDKPIDFRVNSLPTVYGEKIVMRILDKSNLQVDMTQLGFEEDQLKLFKNAILSPFGMVLVTGPTGSGKTTTLYSALQELNREDTNIMTAEDPVEYNLTGVNQVQMKSEIGLNFAESLRAFLRQDPDVIMVGEIRDLETAEIGIKAALTGHMVLSTLHTNSAADTVSRLLNMGVAPFNLVAALNCVTAQRLVRKICTYCRQEDPSVSQEVLKELGISPAYASKVKAYIGKGCAQCAQAGTKGRIAVHEVMVMNEEIKKSILRGDPSSEIKKIAMRTGMKTLRQSALTKMVQGITTIKEVLKTTAADHDSVKVVA